jgi:hypothetical protein
MLPTTRRLSHRDVDSESEPFRPVKRRIDFGDDFADDDFDEDEDRYHNKYMRTSSTTPTNGRASGASRFETSLVLLTKRFMDIIKKADDGVVDLNLTAQSLGVSKRRLYDITNVMEGWFADLAHTSFKPFILMCLVDADYIDPSIGSSGYHDLGCLY